MNTRATALPHGGPYNKLTAVTVITAAMEQDSRGIFTGALWWFWSGISSPVADARCAHKAIQCVG